MSLDSHRVQTEAIDAAERYSRTVCAHGQATRLGVNYYSEDKYENHSLELEQASDQRIWAYRKAAWTVDECPASVAELYAQNGEAGLRELPGIGKSISHEITKWLAAFAAENR
jgi:hypothetical protein